MFSSSFTRSLRSDDDDEYSRYNLFKAKRAAAARRRWHSESHISHHTNDFGEGDDDDTGVDEISSIHNDMSEQQHKGNKGMQRRMSFPSYEYEDWKDTKMKAIQL
jgi:ribosomal protein L21E